VIANPGGGSYVAAQLGGGHADAGIASFNPLKSQLDAGNIRILGITTAKRVPGFEQWPTLKEQGIDMVLNAWAAHVAPKGLPPEVHKRLTEAHAKVAASREFGEICARTGSIPTPENVGQQAVKFLDDDAEMQRPILEELGVVKEK
jgi:putative tricarboxylic transport membrane protein